MRSSLIFLFSALLISAAVAAKLGKRQAGLQNTEAGTTSDPCDCACACPQKDCALACSEKDCACACPPKPDQQALAVEGISSEQGPENAPPAQQVPQAEESDANLGFLLN